MKLLFAGGVTGGHIAPGVALAEYAIENHPGCQALFASVANEIEERMIARRGLDLVRITGRTRGTAGAAMALPAAMLRGRRLLKRYRPDMVIGLGAGASLGTAAAAITRRTPMVLLEQNIVPGRTNRFLGGRAAAIFCQWQEAADELGGNALFTGSPVRKEIAQSRHVDRADACRLFGLDPDWPILLVMGGSQGASPINAAMLAAARRLAGRAQIIHLTGRNDLDRVTAGYRDAGVEAHVTAFFEMMHLAYGAADLALARAGATSIAEFAAAGLPAILVPYPYARDDHQRANARAVEQQQWGVPVDQDDLTPDRTAGLVLELLDDDERRRAMAANARQAARDDAASLILEHLGRLVDQRADAVPAATGRKETQSDPVHHRA